MNYGTDVDGAVFITNKVWHDDRGHFVEQYRKDFDKLPEFVQDNKSFSKKGVLRGLHYQKQFPQGKLVSVQQGMIFDVCCDIRKNSKTFGKWAGFVMGIQHQFYLPPGVAHGFLALEDAVVTYKCTDYYHKDDEAGIIYNDPTFNICWEQVIKADVAFIMSEKDKNWAAFTA